MRSKLKLNSLYLIIIATVLMLVDHIACLLISPTNPAYLIMRTFGRISAPLFWFCFVEGYRRTSNRVSYAKRLFFATIVMAFGNWVLYVLLYNSLRINISLTQPNIFLTMFLMLLTIECIKRIASSKKVISKILFILLLMLLFLAVGCGAEYGWIAFFSILCLYFIKRKGWKYTIFVLGNVILCCLLAGIIQMFMVFAAIPMILYDEAKPKRGVKWFFYIFYPVHLWILIILSTLI